MTGKRLLRPEQSLLLKVADYLEEGNFCQGTFWQIVGDGKVQRCPLSAIQMLGRTMKERREAASLLAEHVANLSPDHRVVFTNGKIDADETIVEWVDARPMKPAEAAAMVRSASGVLPEQHTPTAIVDSEDAG